MINIYYPVSFNKVLRGIETRQVDQDSFGIGDALRGSILARLYNTYMRVNVSGRANTNMTGAIIAIGY